MSDYADWYAPGSDAAGIPGWLSPLSARAISAILAHQDKTETRGALVEIGVYLGKTFIGMAKAARPQERAVAVDIFTYEGESTFEPFVAGLKAHVDAEQQKRVVVVRQDSSAISPPRFLQMVQSPVRFAHVDGDHTRSAVINDIQLVCAALSEKGVVVIDDFLHPHYADVTEGILDALRASANVLPIALIPGTGDLWQGGHKLICCARGVVTDYKRVLRSALGEVPVRQHPLLGEPIIAFVTPKPPEP